MLLGPTSVSERLSVGRWMGPVSCSTSGSAASSTLIGGASSDRHRSAA
ncbi:hypothetical protein HH308_15860 [Gordonia sp. TBRC 11910]|uniref:Uncharacterized protein n=1 Tax=Gordonia asplenii TaxID=2725283 RepID=A0A848L500_9ACTN|nr:hypothetical protein [Gordonia asplenii]NMO02688.1 hypothetical protein [Gordonia asplenii]